MSGDEDCFKPLDGLNRRYNLGKQEFILLIRKQKEKEYATLYVTDCEGSIWIQKVDRTYLQKLRDELNLATALSLFSTHLSNDIKTNSNLYREEDDLRIEVPLRIGQGLVMTCDIVITVCISDQEKPQDYKMVMKIFLKQLYQAKEEQVDVQRKKWEKFLVKEEEPEQILPKGDPSYIKQVMQSNMKKASDIKPKNRNLLNPNQKKRKHTGIKFVSQQI